MNTTLYITPRRSVLFGEVFSLVLLLISLVFLVWGGAVAGGIRIAMLGLVLITLPLIGQIGSLWRSLHMTITYSNHDRYLQVGPSVVHLPSVKEVKVRPYSLATEGFELVDRSGRSVLIELSQYPPERVAALTPLLVHYLNRPGIQKEPGVDVLIRGEKVIAGR